MAASELFSGKNCLVFGATHRIGAALCRRIAAQGGFVVAADADETALMHVARASPARIAPLMLRPDDTKGLARLTENWGGDPLHFVVMAQPLHGNARIDDVIATVRDATRALAPILEASGGAAVLMYRAAAEPADVEVRAQERALASLTADLAAEGARINALALHPAALARRVEARVGTVAMMMSLPMSVAVSGAVLPVGQHGMAR